MDWKSLSLTKRGFYIGLLFAIVFIIFVALSWIGGGYSNENLVNVLILSGGIILFSWLVGFIFSWKTKSYNILHIISLIFISLALLTRISTFWTYFQSFWYAIIPILATPLILLELFFIIISFKKRNLENSKFKTSGILSLIGVLSYPIVIFLFSSLFLLDNSGFLLAAAPIIAVNIGAIYGFISFLIFEIISFIYFLMGYKASN